MSAIDQDWQLPDFRFQGGYTLPAEVKEKLNKEPELESPTRSRIGTSKIRTGLLKDTSLMLGQYRQYLFHFKRLKPDTFEFILDRYPKDSLYFAFYRYISECSKALYYIGALVILIQEKWKHKSPAILKTKKPFCDIKEYRTLINSSGYVDDVILVKSVFLKKEDCIYELAELALSIKSTTIDEIENDIGYKYTLYKKIKESKGKSNE